MVDREKETLKHFGYEKPLGIVGASQHNKQPFDYFAEVIKLMKLDETRKTRIVFDYDPNFAHCLTQVVTFP